MRKRASCGIHRCWMSLRVRRATIHADRFAVSARVPSGALPLRATQCAGPAGAGRASCVWVTESPAVCNDGGALSELGGVASPERGIGYFVRPLTVAEKPLSSPSEFTAVTL